VVVVASVVVGLVGWSIVRRSEPKVSGTATLSGLGGEVKVVRNDKGVPDIYADNPQDLFMAQGYVSAQDRFFQMDLRRHITAGRLSELVGKDGLDADEVIRTMGWRRVAEAELPTLDPMTRQYLQSYADGVNAWIHSRSSTSAMALEYPVLAQSNPDYTVEDWTPLDSLTWLKAMAWDLRSDYTDEVTRAQLAGRMSLKQIAEVYPAYPFATHQPILGASDWPQSGATPAASSAVPQSLSRASSPSLATPSLAVSSVSGPKAQSAYAAVQAALAAVPQLVGRGDGIGSNSFVVGGALTSTGKPLLANDPHLSTSIPSVWSQVGLHCRQVSSTCPFDVSGFAFAGMPGVIIGHNQSIAWGMTNLAPDVSDFYLEQVQGETTLRDGSWVPMDVRQETIKVAGGADKTITVRSTVHGPVLSDVLSDVADAGDSAPVTGGDANASYAVSLAWTGLTPNKTADALFAIDRAQNFTDFRTAAKDFAVPSQNLVYADTAGHIGYQAPGLVPIRASAFAGSPPGYWPAPGWSSSFDWKGYVPFAQLPWVEDPRAGFIVTANQAVTATTTPFLTSEWDYGFRSQRIRDLLATHPKVTPGQMGSIQMDNRNTFAPTLVKALLAVDLKDDPFTHEGQELLRGWDFMTPADGSRSSAAAAYFNAVWSNLLRLTYDDELPPDAQASGGSQWMQAMTVMLANPRSAWWDNKSTPGITEGKDEILRQALVAARQDLTQKLGKDPSEWRWGTLHQLDLQHPVLGGSTVPAPVRWVFNHGGVALPGGSSIVDANGWDAASWNSPKAYAVTSAPSMRMVVDLSRLDGSTWVNQTGQSGQPFSSHYTDQVEAWAKGEQYPWAFSSAAVDKAGSDTLLLTPAGS
jgi:penicillin amidase